MTRNSEDVLFDPPPPAADERIAYGPEPKQFADLRLPRGDGPFPLATIVHGGFWRASWNLIHAGHMCVALAQEGIATWNVEYRAGGDVGGGWPATLEDVGRALAHVEELRGRHPLGATVLVGHSAGGHLALLAARRAELPVVAIAAVSDVAETVRRLGPDNPWTAFAGPEPRPDANPIEQLPLGRPQILIHGSLDDSVPIALSERYVAAAKGQATLVRLEGAGHFDPIDPLSREWPRTVAAIRQLLS